SVMMRLTFRPPLSRVSASTPSFAFSTWKPSLESMASTLIRTVLESSTIRMLLDIIIFSFSDDVGRR
ncbi:hypothetical protein VCHC50A2_1456B, partial [Vibrio cholerae HC-50A2]